ncbi:MAG: Gfo/Idh/MocA family oxidoreductase [Verrucomicrobiales bacterium]|nr:Gfo/Idh/MocA family oxidoreductase [Verrucomicrobiales bacterium]
MITRRLFLQASAGLSLVGRLAAEDLPAPAIRHRAAVIGHTGRGDYGHGLELIFQGRPGIELVAVADPDPAGRQSVGKRIGAPKLYSDFREMLKAERPSLVSVAMRHADQHHAICRAALEAGAHLYVEKPFTCSPDEADDLLALSRRKGLKIAVAHTVRLAPKVLLLRQAIREGRLGDLVELRAYGKQDARAGGEDLMVLGTHLLDLMRLFAGDPVNCSGRVRWQGRSLRPEDRRKVKDDVGWVAGDEVFASFEFPGGVMGSFASHGKLRETVGYWGLELYGSRGVARINSDTTPHVFLRSSTNWTASGREDRWQPLEAGQVKSPPPPALDASGDWLAAVAQDREPECSAVNAAWAVEMVMAVYASALEGGRPVTFPLKSRKHPLSA